MLERFLPALTNAAAPESRVPFRSPVWLITAVVVAGTVIALAGCSDDDAPSSGKAITRVGDATISQNAYRKAYQRAIRTYVVGNGYTPRRRYYDPPHFRWCVHDRAAAGGTDGGLSPELAEERCRLHIRARRGTTLQSLIQTEWLVQESERLGIDVPPDPSHDTSGRTQGRMVRAILAKAAASQTFEPSLREVETYYLAHRRKYVRPERRHAVAIVTRSSAHAVRAKAALRRGDGWSKVASRFGLVKHPIRLQDLEGSTDDPVSEAAFSAPNQSLVGPLRASDGVYLLRRTGTEASEQVPFDEMRPVIENQLRDLSRQEWEFTYVRRLRERARRTTVCLTRLRTPSCRNGSRRGFDRLGATGGWAVVPAQGGVAVPPRSDQ